MTNVPKIAHEVRNAATFAHFTGDRMFFITLLADKPGMCSIYGCLYAANQEPRPFTLGADDVGMKAPEDLSTFLSEDELGLIRHASHEVWSRLEDEPIQVMQ